MSNLTITIDAETLRRARIRALEQGTSVNGVVREFLEAYGGTAPAHERSARSLLERSERATSKRGKRVWSREELHDRAALR